MLTGAAPLYGNRRERETFLLALGKLVEAEGHVQRHVEDAPLTREVVVRENHGIAHAIRVHGEQAVKRRVAANLAAGPHLQGDYPSRHSLHEEVDLPDLLVVVVPEGDPRRCQLLRDGVLVDAPKV